MQTQELIYQLALKQITKVGDITAKNLVAYCGSASAVFKTKRNELIKIPHVGEYVAKFILESQNDVSIFNRAEKEIRFIEEQKVTPLFFTDPAYPNKLKHCSDAPILLFYKGNADLNKEKILGVIGTRNATDYGKSLTEKLLPVHEL